MYTKKRQVTYGILHSVTLESMILLVFGKGGDAEGWNLTQHKNSIKPDKMTELHIIVNTFYLASKILGYNAMGQ